MDMRTSGQLPSPLEPNRVLQELRARKKWGRPRLARELHNYCMSQAWASPGQQNIAKQIYRLETGRVRAPDEFYSRLYVAFFDRTAHELFGRIESNATNGASGYLIRSHKFIPVFVGPSGLERLLPGGEYPTPDGQLTECLYRQVDKQTAIYGWPCGIAVIHVVDELTPRQIADIAVWRRETYPRNIADVAEFLSSYDLAPLNDPYVLSAYWVEHTPHDEVKRDAALRLLCVPRVLTQRDDVHSGSSEDGQAHAELVEATLLREGFDHSEIHAFGVRGISTAYASWSGVVYHPAAQNRALTERELIACELSVQATWAYCDVIRSAVEQGDDPDVPIKYGWRYLRAMKSRLTVERPQETSQHKLMREAIVKTSGLPGRLDQALDALKECGR